MAWSLILLQLAEASSFLGRGCAPPSAPENLQCRQAVESAQPGNLSNLQAISGVTPEQATLADIQRLYYCAPPGAEFCGLPPCRCTKPPCHDCFAGQPLYAARPGCAGKQGIGCVAPKTAMGYKGQHWPTTTVSGKQEMHVFCIGDWGGMDGSLDTAEGRHKIVAYEGGRKSGPSVFPNNRWNKNYTLELCDHHELVQCFNTQGRQCSWDCGYVAGVDDQPQLLVAKAMKARAAIKDPQYILNVGDNFYWGGIEKTCGSPMNLISYPTKHQFDQIFEGVYQGVGLTNKPWFSVLGNHDWGGFTFDNAWDQQISYTWASDRWVLPAPYYKTSVVYEDLDFDVDLFFLDSNVFNAEAPEVASHNICSREHNKPTASCAAAEGPTSVENCPTWFAALWEEQKQWVKGVLSKSKATWQIAVTHFPCGYEQSFYKGLAELGLDLLVTGHRHDQELWLPDDDVNLMGLTCLVTGGGGGVTSEASLERRQEWHSEAQAQYGFYDLSISKSQIFIESVNYDGAVLLTHTIHPSG